MAMENLGITLGSRCLAPLVDFCAGCCVPTSCGLVIPLFVCPSACVLSILGKMCPAFNNFMMSCLSVL